MRSFLLVTLEIVLVATGGLKSYAADQQDADAALLKDAKSVFAPMPANMAVPARPVRPEMAKLGHMLFFDPRASVDGTVSCMRCHQPALYGTDGLPKSRGAYDKLLGRNAPTILNSAIQFKQHWDGVNDDVEMQAVRALTGKGLGNPDDATALAKLRAIPAYPELFKQAFPEDKEIVTLDQWATAIGAYERTLVSPAPFDDYLRGKLEALSAPERKGLAKFVEVGCADCHSGPDVGGTKFEKFGVVSDYWKETHSKEVDKGRFDVTHNNDDLYAFKVPGLRNVAKTPPYFHDGSVATLPATVRIMAKVQLGSELSDEDVQSIVTFLKSLTGPLPAEFKESPILPSAGFVPAVEPGK